MGVSRKISVFKTISRLIKKQKRIFKTIELKSNIPEFALKMQFTPTYGGFSLYEI